MAQTNRKAKSPRGPAAIREAQRDAEALHLRAEGMPLRDIAAHFGLTHQEQAGRMIDRALARMPGESGHKLRHLWDKRHERAARRAMEIMDENHYAVSNGKVVKIDGVPVFDRMPNVAAIKALMDVSKRSAALRGLDAPARRSVEVVTQNAVEREIARLEAELGDNDHRGTARPDQAAS